MTQRSILNPNGGFRIRELTRDGLHTTFVASQNITLEKEASLIRQGETWGLVKPYRFQAYLSHVGKSSFAVTQFMYDHKTGRKLMSATTKLVFIDKKTRKPSRLPDWYIEKARRFLTGNNELNQSLEKVASVTVPKHCFSYEVKALQSHCDLNFHVNQSEFLKWCTDVGALVSESETYRYFKKGLGTYAIQNIYSQYLGEAVMDETILVNTWDDIEDERKLHFTMSKDGRQIFQAELKYFAETADETMTSML